MTHVRHRTLIVISTVTASLLVIFAGGAAATPAKAGRPVQHSRPKLSGRLKVGSTLVASPGRWSGVRTFSYRWERCSAAGTHCKLITAGRARRPVTGRKYKLTKADAGHRIRVIVSASNGRGVAAASSGASALVVKPAVSSGSGSGSVHTSAPSSGSPSGPGSAGAGSGAGPSSGGSSGSGSSSGGTQGSGPGSTSSLAPVGSAPNPNLFTLVPSSGVGTPPAGIPRSDATCAAAITPTGEKRPSNTTANHTVPANPAAIKWNPGWNSWPGFTGDRKLVTGNFKGTTDEIIQWAACKWGLDVNVARADAWLESGWYMATRSGCAGPEASFGLFQIMAEDCNGDLIHGGWPYVQNDTALNADYWGAWIRGCFDGAFLVSGQPWQNSPAQGYDNVPIAKLVAQHGEYYALWGCIGAWFSNAWYTSPAQGYINTVQKDEAAQPWLQPGT